MNYDEFAFFNQQMASMLKAGVPLEGSLKQLATSMQAGPLRAELQQLEADLARGTPLREALPRRKLPEFYVQMVQIAAAGEDLPGMLSLLADYYRRRQALWTRLKALMVYPFLVLLVGLGLSGLCLGLYRSIYDSFGLNERALPAAGPLMLWLPPVWLLLAVLLLIVGLLVRPCREWLSWRLPGFKEVRLCQFASVMRLLLGRGGNLNQALGWLIALEQGTELGAELRRWQQRLAAGQGKFPDFAGGGRFFPRLFLWLVGESGEDLAGGFARAADLYFERARHRVETLLYSALPVAVLVLGLMVLMQVYSVFMPLAGLIDMLGSVD